MRALVAMIALGWATVGSQAARATEAPAAAPVAVTASVLSAGLPLEARGEVALGAPVVLEIKATAPRDAKLFAPLRPVTGTFRLLAPRPGSRKVEGDTLEEVYRLELMPMRLGFEKIPPIEVPYELADGERGAVATAALTLRVRGRLENEQNPLPGAAPDPVEVIGTNWLLIWSLSVLGALVLAALLTLFVLRALHDRFEALAPKEPPRPAIEVAIERLDALDGASHTDIDGASRVAQTIDILRDYIERRYGVDALEMTTPELMRNLADVDLKSIEAASIEDLLSDADLVKFAKLTPSEEQARAKSPLVRDIVTETWEPPEESEDEDEVETLDRATWSQRFYAGGIDVGIGGAASLIVFFALWVAGRLELGWTALLLLGLWLLVRDSIGPVSPGKRILRLSLVQRSERQPPAFGAQRVKRNLTLLLWPLLLPLEAMVLRRHPLGLRLGDIWADTEVVQGGRR